MFWRFSFMRRSDVDSDPGPLLGVASEIPAGLEAGVRKQGADTLLREGAIVLKFNASGFLLNRVVVLNGDVVVWV